MPLHAVYDTCVLIPAPLRDLLVRVAEARIVRVSMSDDILDELERVLVRDFALSTHSASRLGAAIEDAFEESVVSRPRYADLPAVGLPDRNDEHVLAVARVTGADVIVTANLRDFPRSVLSKYGVEAIHPDDFVLDLIDHSRARVVACVRAQAALLKNPPRIYDEVVFALARSVPRSAKELREA